MESCADEKSRRNSAVCQEYRIAFTPFFFGVDGMMAGEVKVFLGRLVNRLSSKWDKPYSIVMNQFQLRLNSAILRASNQGIRGTRSIWRSFRYDD